MKRIIGLIFTLLIFSFGIFADQIIIDAPGDGDLDDFDHYQAYLWRIDLDAYMDAGAEIYDVTIYIDDIADWTAEWYDILWVNMVDPNYLYGTNYVTSYYDGQYPSNYFATIRNQYSASTLVGTWSDPSYPPTPQDISFSVDVDLFNLYREDNNNIGFGFDGDCHYWNNGVRLVINTNSVSEPTLISLLGCGLLGLFLVRRRRS